MRDIVFAFIYLVCAAVLTAFPAFLLFALFHEPETQVAARERAPVVETDAAVKTTVPTTASVDASRNLSHPTWIAPTPSYDYDPSAIPVPSAAALEALAMEPSPVTEGKARRAKKPSAPEHEPSPRRHAVVDTVDSEIGIGILRSTSDGRQVYDTPPINPD